MTSSAKNVLLIGLGAIGSLVASTIFENYTNTVRPDLRVALDEYSDTFVECVEDTERGVFLYEVESCVALPARRWEVESLIGEITEYDFDKLSDAELIELIKLHAVSRRYEVALLECQTGISRKGEPGVAEALCSRDLSIIEEADFSRGQPQ